MLLVLPLHDLDADATFHIFYSTYVLLTWFGALMPVAARWSPKTKRRNCGSSVGTAASITTLLAPAAASTYHYPPGLPGLSQLNGTTAALGDEFQHVSRPQFLLPDFPHTEAHLINNSGRTSMGNWTQNRLDIPIESTHLLLGAYSV